MKDLPKEICLTDRESGFEPSEEFLEMLCDEINEYLANAYGFCNKGWCWELKVSDIDWDTED